MLLGTLGASWLGNLLIGKATIWPGEGTIRADEKVLMLPHLLTNSAYSRNNLYKVNVGAYIINLDEYEPIGTHWIVLYVNDNNVW